MGHLSELEQTTWLNELQDKGAKIVQVLFPRTANNEKELTVEKYDWSFIIFIVLVYKQ